MSCRRRRQAATPDLFGSTIAHVVGWSADGREIHFVANPRAWYEGETRPFVIAREGGEPRDLISDTRARFRQVQAAAGLGRNAVDPARWKRYRGGTAGEVWIRSLGSRRFRKTQLPDGNPAGRCGSANASTSWPIRKASATSTRARSTERHTRHSNESEYYGALPSTDGSRIVYSSGGAISVIDIANESATQIEIEAPSPNRKACAASNMPPKGSSTSLRVPTGRDSPSSRAAKLLPCRYSKGPSSTRRQQSRAQPPDRVAQGR